MRWGTTEGQLLHHSHRKKPTRRGKNKPQTATLISMHVLRFAQLHSDWSLHNKPVRMKQNCSRKVRETPLMPPLKKKKNRKLKHHILPFLVQPTIFVFIPVSFRLISVYFGVIPARSGTFRFHSYPFRFHSCPFPFVPASFRLVPVYSGSFRYIPFHSVPVLSNALEAMVPAAKNKTYFNKLKSREAEKYKTMNPEKKEE